MNDLIYKQAAIDEVQYEIEMINHALDSLTSDYNTRERLRQRKGEAREILNSIETLPAANRWIPCKERLPELEEDVLLFVDTCWYNVGNLTELDGEKTWCVGEWLFYGCDFNRVKAWMPLPEPYKEEKDAVD